MTIEPVEEFLRMRLGYICRMPFRFAVTARELDLVMQCYSGVLAYCVRTEEQLSAAMWRMSDGSPGNALGFAEFYRQALSTTNETALMRCSTREWIRVMDEAKFQIPWQRVDRELAPVADAIRHWWDGDIFPSSDYDAAK